MDCPYLPISGGREGETSEGGWAGPEPEARPLPRLPAASDRAPLVTVSAPPPLPPRPFPLGAWDVDLVHGRITRGPTERRLTTREARLLAYLLACASRPVPRDELLTEVWGYAAGSNTRTVDVTVARLRAKLDDRPPTLLVTERGAGYRLVVESGEPVTAPTGREDDLARIRQALGAGAAVVTLLDFPGVGTTTLGRWAAEQLGVGFLDEPGREDVASRLSPQSPLIVTASAPLVLPGEHRLALGPLTQGPALALLQARLDAAGLVRTAGVDRRLRTIAQELEGHPGLLVAAADDLAGAGLGGLVAAADDASPARLARQAAQDPQGPCGDLGALVSTCSDAQRAVLDAAAGGPRAWDELEDLADARSVELLLERSLLARTGGTYAVPLPLRLWLRASRAARAADAIQS